MVRPQRMASVLALGAVVVRKGVEEGRSFLRAWSVSMLVYIELKLAGKNCAPVES